jgi:Ca2+-dependent lipid-binding protein
LFDWNQIEQAKKLGSASIELADLEPFQGVERTVSLTHTKHGDKGELRVRLTFQPEIIAKSRKNTSTFSTAGRAMTQIGSLPLGGAKGVAHGVGKLVRHGNKSTQGSVDEEASPTVPYVTAPPPSGQASYPVGGDMNSPTQTFPSSSSIVNVESQGNEMGTLRVTVLDAKDISDDGDPVKPYVTVRIGDKESKTKHVGKTLIPEW